MSHLQHYVEGPLSPGVNILGSAINLSMPEWGIDWKWADNTIPVMWGRDPDGGNFYTFHTENDGNNVPRYYFFENNSDQRKLAALMAFVKKGMTYMTYDINNAENNIKGYCETEYSKLQNNYNNLQVNAENYTRKLDQELQNCRNSKGNNTEWEQKYNELLRQAQIFEKQAYEKLNQLQQNSNSDECQAKLNQLWNEAQNYYNASQQEIQNLQNSRQHEQKNCAMSESEIGKLYQNALREIEILKSQIKKTYTINPANVAKNDEFIHQAERLAGRGTKKKNEKLKKIKTLVL